jgi:hypothetical protein
MISRAESKEKKGKLLDINGMKGEIQSKNKDRRPGSNKPAQLPSAASKKAKPKKARAAAKEASAAVERGIDQERLQNKSGPSSTCSAAAHGFLSRVSTNDVSYRTR